MADSKQQTLDANSARISTLISKAADDARRAVTADRVPLSDIQRVRQTGIDYLSECAATGALPTVRGCAARLGLSRQALYDYAARHPDSGLA